MNGKGPWVPGWEALPTMRDSFGEIIELLKSIDNGATATLNVELFDNTAVVSIRQDTKGSSAGLTARYIGKSTGNHMESSVSWNWNGLTWSGTWKAN